MERDRTIWTNHKLGQSFAMESTISGKCRSNSDKWSSISIRGVSKFRRAIWQDALGTWLVGHTEEISPDIYTFDLCRLEEPDKWQNMNIVFRHSFYNKNFVWYVLFNAPKQIINSLMGTTDIEHCNFNLPSFWHLLLISCYGCKIGPHPRLFLETLEVTPLCALRGRGNRYSLRADRL